MAQIAEDRYPWLVPSMSVDCASLPNAEKLKFGCNLSFALSNPNSPTLENSVEDNARTRWAWLTELKLVTCEELPPSEVEKFDDCNALDPGAENDARLLVARLLATREQLGVWKSELKNRAESLERQRLSLATPEQRARLQALQEKKKLLKQQRDRIVLVDALADAAETVERPPVEFTKDESVFFARLRFDADVFPDSGREERSIARLPQGTLVLRVGSKVRNARRLVFAPEVNFGYVSASMVIDEPNE